MSKIAFLGLGAMGSRIATRLIEAGHTVTVWNRSPSPVQALVALGATSAPTPRDAADGAEFVLSMVTDDAASQSVWTMQGSGALSAIGKDAVVVEISTVSPAWIKILADTVVSKGVQFLEAPVVGTLPQAESGSLIVFAGGARETVAAATPLLQSFAAAIHPVGPVGQGAAMKLVANMLLAVQVAGIAELLGFAEASGIDAKAALEMVATLPSASPATIGMGRLMVARDFAPRFTATLMAKDLRYARQHAASHQAELPVVAASQAVFDRLCAIGKGDENITAVATLYGRAAR
jgi:3-hydroxyisobutyrate dehydrogenase